MNDEDKNIKAFLDMIAWSEGTTRTKGNENGYNVIVGGTLFSDYSDHPRKLITIRPGLKSTAAGRYQLLGRYFDHYKLLLGLEDFGHAAQDAIAIQQIRECKALDHVKAGRVRKAIQKTARIWASFPGAGYGQHENRIEKLLEIYRTSGGKETI